VQATLVTAKNENYHPAVAALEAASASSLAQCGMIGTLSITATCHKQCHQDSSMVKKGPMPWCLETLGRVPFRKVKATTINM